MKKILIIFSVAFLLIGGTVAGYAYFLLFKKPFLSRGEHCNLYIYPSDSFDDTCNKLAPHTSSTQMALFSLLCKKRGYSDKQLVGFYTIDASSSLYNLFVQLTRGRQTPIPLTFNNVRTVDQLAGRLSSQLMCDSTSLLQTLTDTSICRTYGFTPQTIVALFLPNTYEVYWTISPKRLLERMVDEYKRFWNGGRQAKAAKMGITPLQASIIASIAEEETNNIDEMGMVCGLYYNRLKRGIPLQADPTVKFALGQFDISRVLFKHLEVDSPYNTYKYAGLPPGPIRIAEARTIDALLNHTPHDFIFMCAKEDLSGSHNFAKTNAEHSRNAARYQAALNRLKIFK